MISSLEPHAPRTDLCGGLRASPAAPAPPWPWSTADPGTRRWRQWCTGGVIFSTLLLSREVEICRVATPLLCPQPFPSHSLQQLLESGCYKHFQHFRETGIILKVQKRKAGRLVPGQGQVRVSGFLVCIFRGLAGSVAPPPYPHPG